tara:strand:- start:181 stop:1038 length:858 start_codon:yes stop_codon:yes gene_type:complete
MTTDHYMGAEEHVIGDAMTDYHRYIPHPYVDFDLVKDGAKSRLDKYFTYCTEFAATGFIPKSVLGSVCGVWITSADNTFSDDLAYHAYYAFDYGTLSDDRLEKLYTALGSTEPAKMAEIRAEKIDFGFEGASIGPDGTVLKYVTLFRPQSNILDFFDYPEIDSLKAFVAESFNEWEESTQAPNSFRAPIRIQFDAVDDTTSIEIASPIFKKELYMKDGIDGYLKRKELYFDQMSKHGLLDADQITYCKTNSPSSQQFSIKFKYRNGELLNKKLYTFVVSEFENVT